MHPASLLSPANQTLPPAPTMLFLTNAQEKVIMCNQPARTCQPDPRNPLSIPCFPSTLFLPSQTYPVFPPVYPYQSPRTTAINPCLPLLASSQRSSACTLSASQHHFCHQIPPCYTLSTYLHLTTTHPAVTTHPCQDI